MSKISNPDTTELHRQLAHYNHMFSKYTNYCMHLKNKSEDFSQYKKLAYRYLDLHTATLHKLRSL